MTPHPKKIVSQKTARTVRFVVSFSLISFAVLVFVTGCAISPMEVSKQVDTKSETIKTAQAQAVTQRAPESVFTVVKGNYLGSNAIAVSAGAGLPQQYREVAINSGSGLGPLSSVVRNLQNLGLSVRVNPDVTAPPRTANAATVPTALPTGANATATPTLLKLSFTGDLSDYLNQVASQLGISWEYAAALNEVHFFRVMTRTFTVMDVPGSIMFADNMSGGGSGSLGTTGGAGGGGSSGSFGATSSSSINATYNPWEALIAAINVVLTPAGKIAANQATGTVVVSDSKEGVDRVGNLIAQENARMNLQVAIDVREITVQLNDGSSLGLDLNLVYQKFNAVSGSPDWVFKYNAPSSLADSAAGSVGYNVARPTSRLAGSSVAAQALSSFGKVVSDKTDTILTRNRVPGRFQRVTEQAYLASTTPATGGGISGGGTGVPGLTPGVVTYGSTITLVPTVGDSNQVVLQLFDTQSDLLGINSVSTGSGLTLQQINTPILSRRKFAQSFTVQHGETLIIVGSDSETLSSDTNAALSGASNHAKRIKGMSVLMVTPRIMTGG